MNLAALCGLSNVTGYKIISSSWSKIQELNKPSEEVRNRTAEPLLSGHLCLVVLLYTLQTLPKIKKNLFSKESAHLYNRDCTNDCMTE